jgi:hypothetical protein
VQSIRIVRGLIECRWPDRVALVDDRGESRFTIWGGFDAPRVTSIPAAARRCWLLESPTVAVACAAPVGQHPMTFMNNPGEQGEISWQPGAARYFRLDYQARQPTFCIEVPARATLRDGFSGPVVLVLAYTDTAESAGFPLLRWIVDRDGSCARMASSVDGIHRYQWNHLTAPYFFESHSVPGLLVPVPVSGEEQRPEA